MRKEEEKRQQQQQARMFVIEWFNFHVNISQKNLVHVHGTTRNGRIQSNGLIETQTEAHIIRELQFCNEYCIIATDRECFHFSSFVSIEMDFRHCTFENFTFSNGRISHAQYQAHRFQLNRKKNEMKRNNTKSNK